MEFYCSNKLMADVKLFFFDTFRDECVVCSLHVLRVSCNKSAFDAEFKLWLLV